MLIVLLLMMSLGLQAQDIQSVVIDATSKEVVEMATVRLLSLPDSTMVQGVQTDMKGNFRLQKVKPGNYFLLISSIGYENYGTPIKMEKKDIRLNPILLKENVQLLKELDVKGVAAQMVVRGDTLEYNAAAFKLQEQDMTEDLLKKLPGVEIGQDGKITVHGQEINRITVDGKKFFDGDIEMATKNLPADMIEKVQVLEEKSEMAKLTGFEDDDTERIINLTTKPNRRKGIFGNVVAGAGLDTENLLRYNGNANFNIMNENSQTSIIGGANNINVARSGRGRMAMGGSSNGITSTQNLGVNNNTILNDKLKIGGDASFNHSNNLSETNSMKESYLKGSTFNDSTFNTSKSDSYATSMRLEVEWKPDSLTTLIIQPTISHNTGRTNSYRDYLYLQDEDTTSFGKTLNTGSNYSVNGGLRLIASRKFAAKPGRTLTANLFTNFSQTHSESYNFSTKNSSLSISDIVNQYTDNKSDRFNFNARVSFVEPLWNNKNMLETVVSFGATTQQSSKDQYQTADTTSFDRRNPLDYTDYVDEYSNNFSNKFYRETLELNYRYTESDYHLTLGMKAEPSQTYSQTLYKDDGVRDVKNEVFNFAPNARFQYNFRTKEFLRIDYRGMTRQPSINQMQPVKNNDNLMHETVGNPTLNPAFTNNIRLMYSTFNEKTFSSLSAWLSGNFVKDALVTNRIYDSTGKQYTQTINSKEIPLNFNGNLMFNTPMFDKRFHFNTSTNLGYNTNYGYTTKGSDVSDIDIENLLLGDMSFTRRYSAQEQLSLTYTHDVVEIGTRGIFRYSNSQNNLSDKTTQTLDWTVRGNVVLRLPYDISLSSDINYSNRAGYSNFDLSEILWNASIDKSLFQKKGTLSLRWDDILRQRLNIRQVVGDNSVSFSRYNTLTSYFMLSFSYRMGSFGGGGDTARGAGRGGGGQRGMMGR